MTLYAKDSYEDTSLQPSQHVSQSIKRTDSNLPTYKDEIKQQLYINQTKRSCTPLT